VVQLKGRYFAEIPGKSAALGGPARIVLFWKGYWQTWESMKWKHRFLQKNC